LLVSLYLSYLYPLVSLSSFSILLCSLFSSGRRDPTGGNELDVIPQEIPWNPPLLVSAQTTPSDVIAINQPEADNYWNPPMLFSSQIAPSNVTTSHQPTNNPPLLAIGQFTLSDVTTPSSSRQITAPKIAETPNISPNISPNIPNIPPNTVNVPNTNTKATPTLPNPNADSNISNLHENRKSNPPIRIIIKLNQTKKKIKPEITQATKQEIKQETQDSDVPTVTKKQTNESSPYKRKLMELKLEKRIKIE
jgi:hypothetical protein